MLKLWPKFRYLEPDAEGFHRWVGSVRGCHREHVIEVRWRYRDPEGPRVKVLDPLLEPRPGVAFEYVPHLIFDSATPTNSDLCLYDPDQNEWRGTMFLARTIIPWASEWLCHYETWHVDGIWRGANAPGPISVGDMRDQLRDDAGV